MEDVGEKKQMKDRLNLRQLILILCIFSAVISLLNAFYSIYRIQHDLIVKNTVESHRVYAEKMAEMTDVFIDTAMSQLEYSALTLSNQMKDPKALQKEVDRLRLQTNSFNSIVIVNSTGRIISISPEVLKLKGVQLTDERPLQSLHAKAPIITDPFISPVGNYLTSMSYPIFSKQGEYLGYVAGTIYLTQKNILRSILGKHGYKDGSYLYVVDRNKTLIYHPDKDRIGEVITNNKAINAVTEGDKGGDKIVNSKGITMLAGYAPVNGSGWGIVAQRSETLTLAELHEQMWNVFMKSLPISALTLFVIWFCSILISKPLWRLASVVKNFENQTSSRDDLDEIKPWYFEVSQLKRSFNSTFNFVSNTIDQLQLDTLTDSMTGLLNRRGLDKAISSLREENIPFSVLALDIDYFKKVNDTFGHDSGDVLLKRVGSLIQAQARKIDIVCRSGGEEFIVFLTEIETEQALLIAERIRQSVATHEFDAIGQVTISIGVARWTGNEKSINAVLKNADDALYQAKHNGRNRVELSQSV